MRHTLTQFKGAKFRHLCHTIHSGHSKANINNIFFLLYFAGSCTNAYYCPFHGWSGWSGAVPQASCRRQSRYRDYNQHTRYDIRSNNCNGIKSSCGPRNYEYRDWCKFNIQLLSRNSSKHKKDEINLTVLCVVFKKIKIKM